MKHLILIILLCLAFSQSRSQNPALKKSHIISTKKVYMKYSGNAITDSLVIPVVSDKYLELKKALSEEHLINDEPLANNIKRYEENGTGITWLDYEIPFENKNVLSIHLFYESSNGASIGNINAPYKYSPVF